MKIKDLPKIERPREKLIAKGPGNLKDKELLAILLGTGVEGKNVIEVAEQILQKYPVKNFLQLKYEDLLKIKGINSAKACIILAHNHPSGDNEPSEDDLEITKRIIEAGKIMGVDVLDHVIIAKGKAPYSFKENRPI